MFNLISQILSSFLTSLQLHQVVKRLSGCETHPQHCLSAKSVPRQWGVISFEFDKFSAGWDPSSDTFSLRVFQFDNSFVFYFYCLQWKMQISPSRI